MYIVHCTLWIVYPTLLSVSPPPYVTITAGEEYGRDLHVRFARIALYLFMLEMKHMLIRSARRAIGARVLRVLGFTFP